MLDENEFFRPLWNSLAIPSTTLKIPTPFTLRQRIFSIDYAPAESTTGAFGGNSNWRGPVWFPINVLIIRALLNLYSYYGNDFKVECPTGSGKKMNLFEVSKEIATRLAKTFLRDKKANDRSMVEQTKFQTDPYWKDNILFYEYFHGDNGAGLGASHQTGWTGGIAVLLKLFGSVASDQLLKTEGREELFRSVTKKPEKNPKGP